MRHLVCSVAALTLVVGGARAQAPLPESALEARPLFPRVELGESVSGIPVSFEIHASGQVIRVQTLAVCEAPFPGPGEAAESAIVGGDRTGVLSCSLAHRKVLATAQQEIAAHSICSIGTRWTSMRRSAEADVQTGTAARATGAFAAGAPVINSIAAALLTRHPTFAEGPTAVQQVGYERFERFAPATIR